MEGNGHGTQANMNAKHHGEGGIHPRQFLDDDGLRNIVDGGATVGLRNGHAVQAVF